MSGARETDATGGAHLTGGMIGRAPALRQAQLRVERRRISVDAQARTLLDNSSHFRREVVQGDARPHLPIQQEDRAAPAAPADDRRRAAPRAA